LRTVTVFALAALVENTADVPVRTPFISAAWRTVFPVEMVNPPVPVMAPEILVTPRLVVPVEVNPLPAVNAALNTPVVAVRAFVSVAWRTVFPVEMVNPPVPVMAPKILVTPRPVVPAVEVNPLPAVNAPLNTPVVAVRAFVSVA